MNKEEKYLGIANHDIQMANNSQELQSYVASILCENDDKSEDIAQLHQEIKRYKEVIDKAIDWLVKYQTEWCPEDEVIRDLKQVLDILKEVLE